MTRYDPAVPSVVFFGMNGPFSTTILRALSAAQLAPVLVVEGLEKEKGSRGPKVSFVRARPGFFGRIFSRQKLDPNALVVTEAGDRLADVCLQLGIDLVRTDDPAALRVRARIHAVEPETFVVAGFPCLLPPLVLDLARRGGLNLHPGRLPEERGPSPLFWALKAGRKQIGWTVHVLDEGEDTGDIVATGEIELVPGMDGQAILKRCAQAAAPELVRAVRGLLAGDLVRIRQPKEGARRPRPKLADGQIDPEASALDVYTFVAACGRSYSVFVESGGDRFYVRRAVSYDLEATLPSEYVLSGDQLLLRCNPGIVELELAPDGAIFCGVSAE